MDVVCEFFCSICELFQKVFEFTSFQSVAVLEMEEVTEFTTLVLRYSWFVGKPTVQEALFGTSALSLLSCKLTSLHPL